MKGIVAGTTSLVTFDRPRHNYHKSGALRIFGECVC